MEAAQKKIKVLAVSSSGGHWLNLMHVREALAGCEVVYATTNRDYCSYVGDNKFYVIPEVSRWQKLKIPFVALKIFKLVRDIKPDVVITTGALPGLLALISGRIMGAKTIWLETFANCGELSMSGRIAGRFASLWLTQWPHLARENGPLYKGRIV